MLMLRRSRTKSDFPGYLIGPGGHVNEGEDVIAAAVREVEEEAGIACSPSSLKLKVVSILQRTDNSVWVSWVYRADLDEVKGKLRSSGEGIAEWLPLADLARDEKIFPPSREYLEHILSGKPGILYTNREWNADQLPRTLSRTIN
jgi:8-oxo-dGTP pyrophosphatase MutT (NUDIX family)